MLQKFYEDKTIKKNNKFDVIMQQDYSEGEEDGNVDYLKYDFMEQK